MKSRMIVLIISIIIALTVLIVGVFGLSEAKDEDNNNSSGNVQKETVDKNLETDSNESTDLDKKDETSESVSEEATQEETTSNDVAANTIVSNIPVNSNIDPNKPMVALTFDDGPSRTNTPRILETLKKYNAHATFFMVGYNIEGNEDIIKQMAEQGCEPANHTVNHTDLATLDENGIHTEVDTIANKIKSITGQSHVLIRPPYGSVNDLVMSTLTEPVILWSIDTEDWKTRNAQSTITHIQNNVYDGAIILMHDIHAETADAAVQIIEWLDSQGYQMVTVSEMGYYRRGGLQTGTRYGSLQP